MASCQRHFHARCMRTCMHPLKLHCSEYCFLLLCFSFSTHLSVQTWISRLVKSCACPAQLKLHDASALALGTCRLRFTSDFSAWSSEPWRCAHQRQHHPCRRADPLLHISTVADCATDIQCAAPRTQAQLHPSVALSLDRFAGFTASMSWTDLTSMSSSGWKPLSIKDCSGWKRGCGMSPAA